MIIDENQFSSAHNVKYNQNKNQQKNTTMNPNDYC